MTDDGIPLTTPQLEAVAQKVADRRGIQIGRRGWSYFPDVAKPEDLRESDIQNFLRRYYTRQELALIAATLDQERKWRAMQSSWKRDVSSSDGIRVYAGLPAKLDMALQHDFPHEFGLTITRKSVNHVLRLIERLAPGLMVTPYDTRKPA